MTNTNVDRLVEEVLDLAKLTDAYERNGLMGVQELARSALSQARQEGREEAVEYITGKKEDWYYWGEETKEVDLRELEKVMGEALTTEGK